MLVFEGHVKEALKAYMLRFVEKALSRDRLGGFCSLDCKLTGSEDEPITVVCLNDKEEQVGRLRKQISYGPPVRLARLVVTLQIEKIPVCLGPSTRYGILKWRRWVSKRKLLESQVFR